MTGILAGDIPLAQSDTGKKTTQSWASRSLSYLGIVADGECRDLLCVAKPVILQPRVQVLNHDDAAAGVGKEA